MADVLFVVLILAFFGLAGLLVRFCDRVIGEGPQTRDDPTADTLGKATA